MLKQTTAIALVATSDWYAKTVRRVLKLPINHTCFLYKDVQWGGVWVAEIDRKGLRPVPFEVASKRYLDVEVYVCSKGFYEAMPKIKNLFSQEYDWKRAIFGLLKVCSWSILGFATKKQIQNEKRLYCFEFITKLIKANNMPEARNLDEQGHPKILRDWLRSGESTSQVPLEEFIK